jgi:naphthalene 1,2-dioxygenase system ferredoxin subunit
MRIATTGEVEGAGGLLGRSASGIAIALYHVDGAYFATSDICTHGHARLSDGYLEEFLIECPLHQGLFDVRTGEVKGAPCTKAIAAFPVRLEGEELFIDLAAAPAAQES